MRGENEKFVTLADLSDSRGLTGWNLRLFTAGLWRGYGLSEIGR
jgi:hypothetical protein